MTDPWKSQYLFLWVFDVGRGMAAFVRTPENYGLNIDCGGDGDYRPLGQVVKLILPRLSKYEDKKLAQAVMSHPHVDHYRDVYRMVGWDPYFITCPNDKDPIGGYPDERFNFDLLETTEEDEPLLKVYMECYNGTGDYRERHLPLKVPVFGSAIPSLHYGIFYICPPEVEEELPKGDYVNNCSVMAFLRFGRSSALLPGDMMTSGMCHAINAGCEARQTGSKVTEQAREKTLDKKAFRKWLQQFGCRFLVAPHHGLESAWPEALFDLLEEEGHDVSLALISEKAKPGKDDGKVDARYSSEDWVKGYSVFSDDGDSETRHSVTTRTDGHILVAMHHTGRPTVVVSHDLDWLLTEAPRLVVAGKLKKRVAFAS